MAAEAIEFRNIEQHQYVQNLQDIGGSHLVLILRDLDATLARLKAQVVTVITAGLRPLAPYGEPVFIAPEVRALFVTDPNHFFIEVMERVSQ